MCLSSGQAGKEKRVFQLIIDWRVFMIEIESKQTGVKIERVGIIYKKDKKAK